MNHKNQVPHLHRNLSNTPRAAANPAAAEQKRNMQEVNEDSIFNVSGDDNTNNVNKKYSRVSLMHDDEQINSSFTTSSQIKNSKDMKRVSFDLQNQHSNGFEEVSALPSSGCMPVKSCLKVSGSSSPVVVAVEGGSIENHDRREAESSTCKPCENGDEEGDDDDDFDNWEELIQELTENNDEEGGEEEEEIEMLSNFFFQDSWVRGWEKFKHQ